MTSRQRILTVCQGWDSSLGGVSTVNREISIALAELGHEVTARVAHGGEPHPPVRLAVAAKVEGLQDDRSWLHTPGGLPREIDIVIGHSRFSGGSAVALRAGLYPGAQVVHFVHTSPEQLGRLQGDPEAAHSNGRIERALIAGADLVVGVGPLLAEEARRLARQAREHPPPVHELIPGITRLERPAYSNHPVRRFHMLLYGRAKEELKGAGNAAKITRAVRERGWDVQLTVRGADPAEQSELEQRLSSSAGAQVWVKPFTSDPQELQADRRGADLVIVASLHEDFGLVATEAAGAGIPMLVGDQTGAGMFLSDPDRVPARLGAACVVPDTSDNIAMWADRVEAVIHDLGPQRQRAAELQDYLTANYTWKGAADKLFEALQGRVSGAEAAEPVVLARGELAAAKMVSSGYPSVGSTLQAAKAASPPATAAQQRQTDTQTER